MTILPLSLPRSNSAGVPQSPTNKPKPLTSIAHLHDADRVSSSASERPKISVFDKPTVQSAVANEEDQITDYLREKAILKKMKEKRMAKAAGAYDIEAGTGSKHRTTGKTSFDKRLQKQIRMHRSTLGNIAEKERKLFSSMVGKRAKPKAAGGSFNTTDKRILHKGVFEAWEEGRMSKDDRDDFGKIVDNLKK